MWPAPIKYPELRNMGLCQACKFFSAVIPEHRPTHMLLSLCHIKTRSSLVFWSGLWFSITIWLHWRWASGSYRERPATCSSPLCISVGKTYTDRQLDWTNEMQRPTPLNLQWSSIGTVFNFKQSVLSCGTGDTNLQEAYASNVSPDTQSNNRKSKHASYSIKTSLMYRLELFLLKPFNMHLAHGLPLEIIQHARH